MALGVVLAPYGQVPNAWPYGITQSRGGNGTFVQPNDDPYWNMRGEAGFFHDTALGKPKLFERMRRRLGLGAIPTDAELSLVMGYTPVASNWITTKEGFITPPWLPPNGWPQGGYSPPVALSGFRGFRDADPTAPTPATIEDVVGVMNAHNDRVFALTLISTTAVAVSAMITIFRTLKLIREDRRG